MEGSGPTTDMTLDSSLPSIDALEFDRFRALIRQHTGIWLRDGKQVMLASRLARRLRFHGLASFEDYYRFVEAHKDGGAELDELIDCITTNKTAFFRERHHFDYLGEVVVPELIACCSRQMLPRDINIWSCACSTGEEPYSIAITLLESKAGLHGGWKLRVLGSDIDTKVLDTAGRAIYSEVGLNDIDAQLQKKYFLRGKDDRAGQIKVKERVRSLVDFKRINLMDRAYPLDVRFDAVFFRNALIYFQKDIQELFLRRIARHLKVGGYLFLGHSEHISWLHDLYEPLHKTIYRLRGPKA